MYRMNSILLMVVNDWNTDLEIIDSSCGGYQKIQSAIVWRSNWLLCAFIIQFQPSNFTVRVFFIGMPMSLVGWLVDS